MSTKNQPQTVQQDFQFFLAHQDVVNMMNDPDVLVDGGAVQTTQTFEVWIEKSNGTRIYLRDMQPTDRVMFQFTAFTQTGSPVNYTGINVIP